MQWVLGSIYWRLLMNRAIEMLMEAYEATRVTSLIEQGHTHIEALHQVWGPRSNLREKIRDWLSSPHREDCMRALEAYELKEALATCKVNYPYRHSGDK